MEGSSLRGIEARKNILEYLGISLIIILSLNCLSWAEENLKASLPPQRPIISVLGRLALEQHGEEEWLILHAKDAQTYLIIGSLREKLKSLLLELEEKNLVSLRGNQDLRSNVVCERTYQYEDNKKGERILKIQTQCIPYYHLEVTQILEAKISDEEIPPPKREIEEEKRLTKQIAAPDLMPALIGEIYGKIKKINLKSPIKTIEVENRDKDSPLKQITLIISPGTQIVKKIGQEEPMTLRLEALKAGQEVTCIYSRDEFKSEALFITITKE